MSRKIFFVYFLVLTLVWVGFLKLVSNYVNLQEVNKNISPKKKEVELPKKERPGVPKLLLIPKTKTQASIESLGLDQTGKMDVPKEPGNVGWYNLGYRPGEDGSAVIAGHLDTVTGAPAVFYDLNLLEIGDEIFVIDDKDKQYKFIVTDKRNYSFEEVPLRAIFANSRQAGLNLITCNGNWDNIQKNYSHRIVVYSKLVE